MLRLNILGNILLGIAMLAEPILFGKVIDRISDAAMNGKTNRRLSILDDLLPLLIAWASFSVFCIVVGSAISLHADCLAHNNQWLVAKRFYKHALLTGVVNILSKSPSLDQNGSSSGGLKTIMSEGVGALFWN
jgi:ATP-binding cassette subfamily B protein